MKGMTPQMLASQQMLAVLNQQGLSVSGVKGLNNMMLGNNVGKSGSVTIQVGESCYQCSDLPLIRTRPVKPEVRSTENNSFIAAGN